MTRRQDARITTDFSNWPTRVKAWSMSRVGEVFLVMLRLGTMAFGGPVAHLAHFERELIDKRKWLPGEDFADLIAFCQFLPGPASSQVGMGLGLLRAGLPGMFAAWFAFSLPSVILLLAAAAGVQFISGDNDAWLHGLLAGVVAIVADAVLKMGKKLCPTPRHLTTATVAMIFMLLVPGVVAQLVVIVAGAVAGLTLLPRIDKREDTGHDVHFGRSTMAVGWLILLGLVLAPIFARLALGDAPLLLEVYASFAQTGALVFGGGHVVLPMLKAQVVEPGWMTGDEFLAGYGITQAMPGPIFTLSSFLGATVGTHATATTGGFMTFALVALLAIFMPSFGFMGALFPLWHALRSSERARQAISGINAAVVGLLGAALYDPVWTKAMNSSDPRLSVAIVILSWLLLSVWKRPAWQVVIASALAGMALRI